MKIVQEKRTKRVFPTVVKFETLRKLPPGVMCDVFGPLSKPQLAEAKRVAERERKR